MSDPKAWPSAKELEAANLKAGSLTKGPFPFEYRVRFLNKLGPDHYQDVLRTVQVTRARTIGEEGAGVTPWETHDELGAFFMRAAEGEVPTRTMFEPATFEAIRLVEVPISSEKVEAVTRKLRTQMLPDE